MEKEKEEEVFTVKDFDQITTRISQSTSKVGKIFSKHKRMTVVVGTTGCGKSSLINYLMKTNLEYQKKGAGKYQISHYQPKDQLYPTLQDLYPKIGHQKQSCTTLPQIYDKTYVDLPGWFDTRSTKQQVINGFTNATIFSPGKQVKIIIILQAHQLQIQRGSVLVDIIYRLMELFQLDFAKAINSILLVVSKVKLNQWTVQNIQSELEQISKFNKNLNQTTQFLLKTLIEQKRIALFPNPDDIKNHIQIIQTKLNQLRTTILSHNGSVTLSHKALKVVNSSLNYLNEELIKMSQQFSEHINKFTKFDQTPGGFSQNGDAINTAIERLKISQNILKTQIKICFTFERYIELLEQLAQQLQISNQFLAKMKKNFTMINFYLSISQNAKIDSRFIEVMINKLTQTILQLELKRDKIITSQEKVTLQNKFQAQVREREAKLQKQRRQAQTEEKIYLKELDQELKKQDKMYKSEMMQFQQERFRIQSELQQVKRQVQKKKQEEEQFITVFKGIVQTVATLYMPKLFSLLSLFKK